MWLQIQFIKSKRFLEGEGGQGGDPYGQIQIQTLKLTPPPKATHSIKLCMYVTVLAFVLWITLVSKLTIYKSIISLKRSARLYVSYPYPAVPFPNSDVYICRYLISSSVRHCLRFCIPFSYN